MPHKTTGIVFVADESWSLDIAGVCLLHRFILTGRRAGIHHWRLLTSANTADVQASLSASARVQELDCQVLDMRHTPMADMLATLPAGDVLMVTTPAVVDHHLLAELQKSTAPVLGVLPASTITAERVDVVDGLVTTQTATISSTHDATGIFRCSRTLLDTVLPPIWSPLSTTSAPLPVLLAALLEQTSVHTVDISHHLWVPLTAPSAAHIAAAECQLLQRLGRQDESPIVSRVNRALSRHITRQLMHTSITPNQITVASAFIGLCGAFLLAQPSQLWQVCGGLLFLCSTIIDGCDGEIARLTFQESAFGAKFDIVMDNVVHLFLFPSMAIGLYRQYEAPLYLILGGLAVGGVVLSMIVYMPHRMRPQRVTSTQTRLHDSLASRDFAYIIPLLALVNGLSWFLWATVIGTYLFAVAWLVLARRARHGAP